MGLPTLSQRQSLRRIVLGFGALLVIGFVFRASQSFQYLHNSQPITTEIPSKPSPAKVFVVASMEKDHTAWISEYLPDWKLVRYEVDNPKAEYTVPMNKGREAMVYLTYIIDHYDNLPDIMVFMHGERYQWHNDDPIYDGVPLLKSLQIPYVISQGYTNLRCVWSLGCPSEMTFTDLSSIDPAKTTEIAYPQAFSELFPTIPLPSTIGVACCAQFALTREKIRQRRLSDYQRYRKWITETTLDDHVSGRVFEYSWHIIFGKGPVHCPNAGVCYCKTFGLCELECTEEGKCGERWPFPPFATLPSGWPSVGWDGQVRDEQKFHELRRTSMVMNETEM